MPSFSLSALISRGQLGLADLQVNDGINYRMAGTEFFQGQVAYEREEKKSRIIHAPQVQLLKYQAIGVYRASRKSHQLPDEWYWACEAADFNVQLSGPRMMARQGLVAFSLIRNPVPTNLTWSSW